MSRPDGTTSPAGAREARRPACTKCWAPFTDERWKAVERWGAIPERHQALCETCAHEYDAGIENAWPGLHSYELPEKRPEPKSGRWFARLRP